MPNSLQLRRLRTLDAEQYRRIRLATLETEPDYFGSVLGIEVARPISAFVERLESSYVLGACAGAEVVGVVDFRQESGAKEAHKGVVRGFFVEPASRRQGVGSALMAGLIEAASGLVEQLTLTVIRENTAAISLYERFGFATYGVEPCARKLADRYQDKVLMVRFLDSADRA